MRAGMRMLVRLPVLLSMLLLAGCLSTVKVSSSWEDNADREQSFQKILVVGLSPNAGARCDFESFMTNQLRTTIDAKPSCLYIKTTEKLSREAVERAIAEYQPDAVLTTSLVASSAVEKEGGGSDTRGAAYYKAVDISYGYPYRPYGYYGGYGAWGMPVVELEFEVAPVVIGIEGEVTILSMLFAVDTEELIYQLTTSAKDLKSRDDALATITNPIAQRLRRDGLVAAE